MASFIYFLALLNFSFQGNFEQYNFEYLKA